MKASQVLYKKLMLSSSNVFETFTSKCCLTSPSKMMYPACDPGIPFIMPLIVYSIIESDVSSFLTSLSEILAYSLPVYFDLYSWNPS
uniref:Uncharacterized protein n=1 Tax=Lothians earthworm bunya/orthobunya-like virus 1 TaxID=2021934 RepID=A0A221LFM1_9VIRU|nr:hypothetical protein [Lothians earthworm bunya/orthobunya-like virus 1]